MKVLIFGKNGQLGKELYATQPDSENTIFLGREECDVNDPEQLKSAMERYSPDVVINATAYTRVDLAESEKEQAFQANRDSVAQMGKLCVKFDARLIHISTDFVFDGNANQAYTPESDCYPLNVYGASKLAGEQALAELPELNYLIVRTSWVYSSLGNNFVKTMLKLMQSRDELSVVYNQFGTPTWAKALAKWIWSVSHNSDFKRRIYHWTDAGTATWYDFAQFICLTGCEVGLLSNEITINPIPDSEYPTPAVRPKFSVLDTRSAQQLSHLSPNHWTVNLRLMLQELQQAQNKQ